MRHALLFLGLIAGLSAQSITVTVTGGGQTAVAGTEFGAPITVQVRQTSTQLPVSGVQVTITLPTDGTTPSAFFNFNQRTVTLTTNGLGIAVSPIMGASAVTGAYTGTVTVNNQTQNFSLENVAYAPPSVAPDNLIFSMNLGDPAPDPKTVVVASPTDGYTATVDVPFVKLTLRSNTVLVVAIDPTGLVAGRYQANITVNGTTVIPVSLTITNKPQLFMVFPSGALNFSYVQFTPRGAYQPLDQFVTIWSSQQNLPVAVDETYVSPTNGHWLAAASKRGTVTPVTLEVVVDPTGLAAGTYQANVRVTGGGANNSPLLIPVTLTIRRFPNTKAPEIISVGNGASLQDGAISEGALASVAVTNLNCTAGPVISVDGTAVPSAGGKDGRINFIVPSLGGRSRSQVQVGCDDQISTAFAVPAAAAAPGLVTNPDGAAIADNIVVGGRRALRLFGTGFGPMNPVLPIRVSMGGVQGRVVSLTPSAALPGIMEMVVLVPETVDPGATVPLEVFIDDAPAQPGMRVAVQ